MYMLLIKILQRGRKMWDDEELCYGDLCSDGNRAGCVDLLAAIADRVKPLFHVFGHIHEGYGATTNGATVFINASTCNLQYRPVHPPLVFDLPIKI